MLRKMTSPDNTQLETSRLVLQCPSIDNAGAFTRLANNKKIALNRCSLPHPVTINWAQDYLKHAIENFADRSFTFGIYMKNDISQPYIGEICLSALYNCEPAIAYWLGEKYWNQGYASEALKAVTDFSFSTLGAPFLEADYFLDNPSSGRVLEKNGFKPAGQKLFWSSARMKFASGQNMLLTREDWAILNTPPHTATGNGKSNFKF